MFMLNIVAPVDQNDKAALVGLVWLDMFPLAADEMQIRMSVS